MMIRTQDKKSLLNMNNITAIYFDRPNSRTARLMASSNDGTRFILGEYKSEENAIAVIDRIFEDYNSNQRIYQIPPDFDNRVDVEGK